MKRRREWTVLCVVAALVAFALRCKKDVQMEPDADGSDDGDLEADADADTDADVDGAGAGGTFAGELTLSVALGGERFEGACLSRALATAEGVPLATGDAAPCVVTYTLENDGECLEGQFSRGTDEGHTVCQGCQAADGSAERPVDEAGTDLSACASSADGFWFYSVDEECRGAGKIDVSQGPEADEVVIRCRVYLAEGA